MISSIASRVMPSEGVLDVDHGREADFIAPLRVDYLPGIGHVRRRTLLEELNISLIREIAILDICNLKLVFGRQAIVIHQRSMGIDPTPVHPPEIKPSVSESIILPRDENDDYKLLGILYALVEKCSRRLRNRNVLPLKAGLVLRYSDQIEVSRQVNLSRGSFWDFDLYAPLEQLFFKACQRRVGVRFLRVWFKELRPVSAQLSLFSTEYPLAKRNAEVIRALDRIRERHGQGVITFGKAVEHYLL
jgi:DNA polymerase-4